MSSWIFMVHEDRRTPLYQEDDSSPWLFSKGLHPWRVPLACVWCACQSDTLCVFANRTNTLCKHRIQYLKDRSAVFVWGFKRVFCQSAKCYPELPLHWLKFAFFHKAPGHPALLWPSCYEGKSGIYIQVGYQEKFLPPEAGQALTRLPREWSEPQTCQELQERLDNG